ncbi:hypothetical protein Bxe_B1857 [Paraburkholderia xenovorans LB400]|uniref:Transposase n=1 Tax=Paraburkholderia xenovorans (strain LB400) TaxID=266265 RepID=Q13P78_PARXL|nr:hypothetical protein Bxe_B1857 [Paraburkholderia xenovorans LB400]
MRVTPARPSRWARARAGVIGRAGKTRGAGRQGRSARHSAMRSSLRLYCNKWIRVLRGYYDVHRRPEGKTATGKGWRGNLADQAIGRIEARRVLLLLSKIVIPGK